MNELKIINTGENVNANEKAGVVLREGNIYRAKVAEVSDGAALISINGKLFLSIPDIALKMGEVISLKLIKREADGKLVFKLTGQLVDTAERSSTDILKSIGANSQNPISPNVLDSFIKFGLKLEASKINQTISALHRIISAGDAASVSTGADMQILSDAAALIKNSNIPLNANSLKLAAQLINIFSSAKPDFNNLFSLAPQSIVSMLSKIESELSGRNKKTSETVKKLVSVLSLANEKNQIKLMESFFSLVAAGKDAPQPAVDMTLKELISLKSEIEKSLSVKAEAGPMAASNEYLEALPSLIENYSLLNLYSAISNTQMFKLPFSYEGEDHEALCEIEKKGEKVSAVNMYLSLSALDNVKVSIQKTDSSFGIYFFVKNTKIKSFIEGRKEEIENIMNAVAAQLRTFLVAVGKKRDFIPGILKNSSEAKEVSKTLDISI